MSAVLWSYFFDEDVDGFTRALEDGSGASYSRSNALGFGTSPGRLNAASSLPKKARLGSLSAREGTAFTKRELNYRDAQGCTLLQRIASSQSRNASLFAAALLKQPGLDLYVQDAESGWTALHRALYFGNVTIARDLMRYDQEHSVSSGGVQSSIIKIKDREGNSPFDLYESTIAYRNLDHDQLVKTLSGERGADDDDDDLLEADYNPFLSSLDPSALECDEVYVFGSNKNLNLGLGDQDDRHFPERVVLYRSQELLNRLNVEHIERSQRRLDAPEEQQDRYSDTEIAALVKCGSIKIRDIQISKYHTAIVTTDPEANLYVCGFGQGGRLGLGDQSTRFAYACVTGGGFKNCHVKVVGLGQDHTLAITNNGQIWSWGSNAFGQLGYSVAATSKDETPRQLFPRQIFGTLKRDDIIGCAASRLHSVVYSADALYTFGKNEGQLGLFDADARSLQVQSTPRQVAAAQLSRSIIAAEAIDHASIVLLENHEVWVFANYGYQKVAFPLDATIHSLVPKSFMTTRYDNVSNYITKISACETTLCALSREGDVWSVTIDKQADLTGSTASTTGPSKIRNAVSRPQRVWTSRTARMAVRDLNVGSEGSVIICTEAGSVWRRVQRTQMKAAHTDGKMHKSKDFKFSRVPGLARVDAVRSNAFGTFAALRTETDVLRQQVQVDFPYLWQHVLPLMPRMYGKLLAESQTLPGDNLDVAPYPSDIKASIIASEDIEGELLAQMDMSNLSGGDFDVRLKTSTSDLVIPCHEFLLSGRSIVLAAGFADFRSSYFWGLPDLMSIEYDKDGIATLNFSGVDVLTLLNLVFYLYTDEVLDFWHYTKSKPAMTPRFRHVRVEVMKMASALGLDGLEKAARMMVPPTKRLHHDLDRAIRDERFFEMGDIELQLEDDIQRVHSAFICQRCPFFDAMFHGRAQGEWLAGRRKPGEDRLVRIDLSHVSKEVFGFALRYLYADVSETLFDSVVINDPDDFLNLVLDVMALADELILDRLAQTCQKILGQFTTSRNLCWLLNEIAPSSIQDYKKAALEFVCLNLEGLLENRLLEDLDDDLMAELDEAVKQNQLACLPFAKSGRAEQDLLERYPDLNEKLEQARRIKLDSLALRSRLHEAEAVEQSRTGKSPAMNPKSPALKARKSGADLMFDMDDESTPDMPSLQIHGRPSSSGRPDKDVQFDLPPSSLPMEELWLDHRGKSLTSPTLQGKDGSSLPHLDSLSLQDRSRPSLATPPRRDPPRDKAKPWTAAVPAQPATDLRSLLDGTQTTPRRVVSGPESGSSSPALTPAFQKMSQKERKRMMQQQQIQTQNSPSAIANAMASPVRPSAWSTPSPGYPASPGQGPRRPSAIASPLLASSPLPPKPTPELTLRQTVARTPSAAQKSAMSASSPSLDAPNSKSAEKKPLKVPPKTPELSSPLTPRSVRYIPAAEPVLGLSMQDILSQQQLEKELIREATSKRNLQDIQQEQEFQAWWDAEEAKTKAAMAAESSTGNSTKGEKSRRPRTGGKARGGGQSARGGRSKSGNAGQSTAQNNTGASV